MVLIYCLSTWYLHVYVLTFLQFSTLIISCIKLEICISFCVNMYMYMYMYKRSYLSHCYCVPVCVCVCV